MEGHLQGNDALAAWMKQQTDAAALHHHHHQQQQQQHPPPSHSQQLFASSDSSAAGLTTQQLLDQLAIHSPPPPIPTNTLYAAFPSHTGTSAIPFASAQPSHSIQPHDSNSYDDSFPLVDNYSYGTPSYAGSWASSSDSAAAAAAQQQPSPWSSNQPASTFLSLAGGLGDSNYNPFLSYRDLGAAGQDEEAGSAYGGSSAAGGASSNAGGSTAGSVVGAADDLGGMVDFDFEPMMLGDGGQQQEGGRRSASPLSFQGENTGMRYRMGAGGTFMSPSQQHAEVTSADPSPSNLPLVFTSPLSESPPLSTNDFLNTTTRTTSPPLLAPLAIPSDGPSFNLIQPTPHTARPKDRQKGAGTLELESILGMGQWPTKETSSFSDFSNPPPPPASSSAGPSSSTHALADPTITSDHSTAPPRPLLSSTFSSPPESFDLPAPTAAAAALPPTPLDSLAVPRPPATRRRSRSEADIRETTLNFHNLNAGGTPLPAPPPAPQQQQFYALQQQQFFDLSSHPPPPPHPYFTPPTSTAPAPLQIDPQAAWSLMSTQSHFASHHLGFAPPPPPSHHLGGGGGGEADLAEQVRMHQQLMQQHELASATRTGRASFGAQGGRGGPGYREAGGMFGVGLESGEVEGAYFGGGHRRSRSHGHGQGRASGSRSDEFTPSYVYGSPGASSYGGGGGGSPASMFEGMLAPPSTHRSPSIPPSTRSHSHSQSHSTDSRSPSPANSVHSAHSHHSGFVSPAQPPPPPQTHASPSFPSFPPTSDPPTSFLNHPPPPSFHPSLTHTHPYLGPQTTPYVYHSPIPSPPVGGSPEDAMDDGRGGKSRSGSGSTAGPGLVTTASRTTQATIEAAMRRRNPGTTAKFACDLCGETFTRRYNLKGHQRAHRNEKPFACSYEGCGKAFARAHDCKRHELLHLNVRRYHCDPCGRDFIRLDALQRHHRSDVGQTCVDSLRAQGYEISYDTTATTTTNATYGGGDFKDGGGVQL